MCYVHLVGGLLDLKCVFPDAHVLFLLIQSEVEVEAQILRKGRSVVVTTVEFRLKGTNKLCYTSRATFYIMPVASLWISIAWIGSNNCICGVQFTRLTCRVYWVPLHWRNKLNAVIISQIRSLYPLSSNYTACWKYRIALIWDGERLRLRCLPSYSAFLISSCRLNIIEQSAKFASTGLQTRVSSTKGVECASTAY